MSLTKEASMHGTSGDNERVTRLCAEEVFNLMCRSFLLVTY